MRILAVDPGDELHGYVIITDNPENPKQPIISEFGKVGTESILHIIIDSEYDTLAIEDFTFRPQYMSNESIQTCQNIGRFRQRYLDTHSYSPRLIARATHVSNLTGDAKCDDTQVKHSIWNLYGGKDIAVGNVKCEFCHGNGWNGRKHTPCTRCNQTGYSHPQGPLFEFSELKCDDHWLALSLAIYMAKITRDAQ
jgi:Holliday junction resolvasome RuvABC endonuclease subunit